MEDSVTRIRSALQFALPLALLLGAGTLPAPASMAGWKSDFIAKDGTYYEIYFVKEKNEYLVIHYLPDNIIQLWVTKGDPDPNANSDRGIQPVDVAALIKKGLITYEIRATPENTPLSKWIERGGDGFVPHWNNDNDKGPVS